VTDPESPSQKPDSKVLFGGNQRRPAPNQAIMRALDGYQQGVSLNNTEQIEAAALDLLILAGPDAEENPTPELLLKSEAVDCEAPGGAGPSWCITYGCSHGCSLTNRKKCAKKPPDGRAKTPRVTPHRSGLYIDSPFCTIIAPKGVSRPQD